MSEEINTEQIGGFTEEQQNVLEKVSPTRIVIPILIGLAVAAWLLWKDFDAEMFATIPWSSHTFFWLGIAVLCVMVRHIAYMIRLRVLTNGFFSWKKCFELIFIWEFSSAVTPTNLGGSAVALFVLSQEKLGTAKTATIVLYTVVLDTLFFLSTLPILYLIFGPELIRPFGNIDGWWWAFVVAYIAMFVYSSLIFIGLFFAPQRIKALLMWFCKFGLLKRFAEKAKNLGNDIILVSKEIKTQGWKFHLTGFATTAIAWSCRFIVLNLLAIALVVSIQTDFWSQFQFYSRMESMFIVIAFSPSPGGAGFAEAVFPNFVNDIIPEEGLAVLVAVMWRLLTFYFYLIAGAIVVPNWIRKIVARRKQVKTS